MPGVSKGGVRMEGKEKKSVGEGESKEEEKEGEESTQPEAHTNTD